MGRDVGRAWRFAVEAGSRRGRMTQDIYPVPAEWQARAKVDANAYAETYARSLSDPEAYWLEQAQRLDWVQMPSVADESSFAEHDFRSEEHTSELQSLMRISYAVFCLKKKHTQITINNT